MFNVVFGPKLRTSEGDIAYPMNVPIFFLTIGDLREWTFQKTAKCGFRFTTFFTEIEFVQLAPKMARGYSTFLPRIGETLGANLPRCWDRGWLVLATATSQGPLRSCPPARALCFFCESGGKGVIMSNLGKTLGFSIAY
jgi:hypothetical protein